MATLATLDVQLKANTAALRQGFEEADRRAKSFTRTIAGVGGALLAYVGSRQILSAMQSLANAWMVQEEAVISLKAALMVTGREGGAALEQLTRSAAALQAQTTKGDEAIISATASFAQLATSLDVSELMQAQKAIIGIADTFLKGDVQSAALLLGKTISSSTNALTRYGIEIDTTASQSAKLAAIMEQTGKFFEVSKQRADSLTGRLQRLANAWGDVKEQFGRFLMEKTNFGEFINTIRKGLEDLSTILASGSAAQIRDAFHTLGTIAGNAFMAGLLGIVQTLSAKLGGILMNVPFLRGMGEAMFGFGIAPGVTQPYFDAISAGFAKLSANARTVQIQEQARTIGQTVTPRLDLSGGGPQLRGGVGPKIDLKEYLATHERLRRSYAEISDSTINFEALLVGSFANMFANIGMGVMTTEQAVIQAVHGMIQAIIQLKAQQLGSWAGPLGGIVGAAFGFIGGLFGGGKPKPQPVPVKIMEFDPKALEQQRIEGPYEVVVQITDPITGNVLYELERREQLDAIRRIPTPRGRP